MPLPFQKQNREQVTCPKTPSWLVAWPDWNPGRLPVAPLCHPVDGALGTCPSPGGVEVSRLTGPNPAGACVGGHDVAPDAHPATDAADPVAPAAAGLASAAAGAHAPAGESGLRAAEKWGVGDLHGLPPPPCLLPTSLSGRNRRDRSGRTDLHSSRPVGGRGRSQASPTATAAPPSPLHSLSGARPTSVSRTPGKVKVLEHLTPSTLTCSGDPPRSQGGPGGVG